MDKYGPNKILKIIFLPDLFPGKFRIPLLHSKFPAIAFNCRSPTKVQQSARCYFLFRGLFFLPPAFHFVGEDHLLLWSFLCCGKTFQTFISLRRRQHQTNHGLYNFVKLKLRCNARRRSLFDGINKVQIPSPSSYYSLPPQKTRRTPLNLLKQQIKT